MDYTLLFLLLIPSIHSHPIESTPSFEYSLIQQACLGTIDFDACTSRLGTARPSHHSVLQAAARYTINEALRSVNTLSNLLSLSATLRERSAVEDCIELLDSSARMLGQSLLEISILNSRHDADVRSWLSAALSNQDTCLEGFEGTDGRLRHYVWGSIEEVTRMVTNLLEVYGSLVPKGNQTDWISEEEMEIMSRYPKERLRVDAVVAKDGTGRYTSVGEAVEEAPSHSVKWYVIYVKGGIYKENVVLKKKKTNIMLVGDGMGVSVLTGNRNFMQGWTTFRTATFAVSGHGFIARDITFRNSAGPQSRQAVALRVDSDRSVFYRCSIEGYQDTLYAHSLRQFYRECHIHGTIDFIFGNGQAVFQNCKIFTRKPLPFQKITITAQGRKHPNQNTGFSIYNSFVYATEPTYLGRPWKAYSRTVFMQSYLGSGVQPAGWLEWAGDFGLNTLFYGEYMNYGPGAGLKGRVQWGGYHVIKDGAAAAFFTVRRFINGVKWLPSTRVPFTADLI